MIRPPECQAGHAYRKLAKAGYFTIYQCERCKGRYWEVEAEAGGVGGEAELRDFADLVRLPDGTWALRK